MCTVFGSSPGSYSSASGPRGTARLGLGLGLGLGLRLGSGLGLGLGLPIFDCLRMISLLIVLPNIHACHEDKCY